VPLQRLNYRFRTLLTAPKSRAYSWATDYRASDFRLAGFAGTRQVEHLVENLILLTDTFQKDPFNATPGARTVKVKLVHLYPSRWAWTSTHVAGPAKYSQFLYQLTSHGAAASALQFTGAQVERVDRPPTRASLLARTRELKREDSALWVRLAAAMTRETS
jgi:hypothetical protein